MSMTLGIWIGVVTHVKMESKGNNPCTQSSDGTPCSFGVRGGQDKAMDSRLWPIPVHTVIPAEHRLTTNEKTADSLSSVSYRCYGSVIVQAVAASLESEAVRSPTNNSDGDPSPCVMQDHIPLWSESGKDSWSSPLTASHDKRSDRTSDMSVQQEPGIVTRNNVPSSSRGSKPASKAAETGATGSCDKWGEWISGYLGHIFNVKLGCLAHWSAECCPSPLQPTYNVLFPIQYSLLVYTLPAINFTLLAALLLT
ncbi:hypothetical protein K439DRAFT_1540171 [Ramaria rubella]|nr:hypothetical protein K439DRAFT_1540171 [Ramaria rubella]